MEQVTVSSLKKFEALKSVPDDELQWLIDNCKTSQIPNGELLTVQGQVLAGPHFILKGRLALYIVQNGVKRELTVFNAGEVTGYLPYSRAVTATASSQAVGEVTMMSFPTERIREMIKDHFEITQA